MAAQENDPSSLLTLYQQLIVLRSQHRALRTGSLFLPSTEDSSLYASLRVNDNEVILIMANLSNHSITDGNPTLTQCALRLGNFSVTPLFGKGDFTALDADADGEIKNYRPLTEIPAYGMYVLQLTLAK